MFTTRISDNTMFECPSRELVMERGWKSNNIESAPNCPRCASSNTKFCYYNNYSLSQPRYFCKGCRRYWTKGGSLRNVPVGGGCRKSRKSKSARQAEQRSGLTYQIPSPGSTSEESNSTSGVNIDLAAVFAKFLNQDSSNEVLDEVNGSILDQESTSSGVSYNSLDLPPSSVDTGNIILKCEKPYDFIHGAQIHEGLPPLCMDNGENVEELLDQNCGDLNLQAVLGDEIGECTHLLSDGTSLPNFEWQSIMQFQDFGSSSSFSIDDEMKIPSNVADENWSSFDLSGYDIFPRHWNCN